MIMSVSDGLHRNHTSTNFTTTLATTTGSAMWSIENIILLSLGGLLLLFVLGSTISFFYMRKRVSANVHNRLVCRNRFCARCCFCCGHLQARHQEVLPEDDQAPLAQEEDTVEPVASRSEPAEPVASKSEAAEPVTSKSEAAEPVTSKSEAAAPVASKSEAAEPVASKSKAVKPVVEKESDQKAVVAGSDSEYDLGSYEPLPELPITYDPPPFYYHKSD